jgi:drug/metabolite transporter (DMT)-like permease
MNPATLRSALAQRLRRIPIPLRAAILLLGTATTWAMMPILIRIGAEEVHPLELAFFRNLWGALLMLPLGLRVARISEFRGKRLGIYGFRSALNLASMLCWFSAATLMPIADMTALGFTQPIWSTIGAVLILGEVLHARRALAVAIGFLGVLIVLRPGFGEIGLGAMLILISSFTYAGVNLIVKRLTRTEHPDAIVFYMSALMTPMSLPFALAVWVTPSWGTLGLTLLLAAVAQTGHICATRAFAIADASAVLPYEFVRLPLAAMFAYLIFAEAPDLFTWIGGTVIFASTIALARSEMRAARFNPIERS